MLKKGGFLPLVMVGSEKSVKTLCFFAIFHILNYVCKKAYQNGIRFVYFVVFIGEKAKNYGKHSVFAVFYEERTKGSSWGGT